MIENNLLKTNFLGKDGFRWWIGQVAPEDAQGDQINQIGNTWGSRVKVRIYGYHPPNETELKNIDLPWAQVLLSPQGGSGKANRARSLRISPGGDISEPVSQGTLRIVKVFWGLDAGLARQRHFPAINWLNSYSLYPQSLDQWFRDNIAQDFPEIRTQVSGLLQIEAELQEIVQLVGSDALPVDQQLTLEVARMIREFFLQQNGFHDVDAYCDINLQYKMAKAILSFQESAKAAMASGAQLNDVVNVQSRTDLMRGRFEKGYIDEIEDMVKKMTTEIAGTVEGN